MQPALNSLFPWSWKPSPQGWFCNVQQQGTGWMPAEELQLDNSAIRAALLESARKQADWLIHPSLIALSQPNTQTRGKKLQQDFQLTLWIAANTGCVDSSVHVPTPLWSWSQTGSRVVSPGNYKLNNLTALPEEEHSIGIALDVWNNLSSDIHPNSWSAVAGLTDDLTSAHQSQLKREIVLFMRSVAWIERYLPNSATWAKAVTKVAVPLYSQGGKEFRSGSTANVAGLIYLDLFGGIEQILEAIIHESAHLHLFLEEMVQPLINPACTALFESPLRPQPRPLRGILMAYHALAYICAFYLDTIALSAPFSETLECERAMMLAKLDSSEQLLLAHKHNLTLRGMAFLEKTLEVAQYART
jgi:hypothetical protein